MSAVATILSIVFAWGVLSLALLGIGASIRRLFGLRGMDVEDFLKAPWLGWAAVVVFLQLWHLWLPVDGLALVVVIFMGTLGLAWCATDVTGLVRDKKAFLLFALGSVVIALWMANQSATGPQHYDTGLYYLNTVRWTSTYPIVPGLGNLHGRLCLNKSYFLYVTLLDAGPFTGKSHQLASGLLLSLLLIRIVVSAFRFLKAGEDWRGHHLLEAIMLVPTLKLAMSVNGSSPSPDVCVYVLGVVVGSAVLEVLEKVSGARCQVSGGERVSGLQPEAENLVSESTPNTQHPTSSAQEERNPNLDVGRWKSDVGRSDILKTVTSSQARLKPGTFSPSFSFFFIVTMSVVGLVAKLSLAMFGIVACVVTLAACLTRCRDAVLNRRTVLWVAAVTALAVVPWMIRGVLLSGYPVFPLTLGSFPVDWKVPEEAARWIAAIVRFYARQQSVLTEVGQDPGPWLWPWFSLMTKEHLRIVTPLMIFAVLCPSLALIGRNSGRRYGGAAMPWAFLLVPIAGLVFWFVQAPLPRLAGACFWLLAGGGLVLTARFLPGRSVMTVFIVLSALLFAQNVNIMAFVHKWQRDTGPVRAVATRTMTTDSGLDVYVPIEGDQCWDAPLPCTPHFNPALRLRVEGDMSGGFAVDGHWELPEWTKRDRAAEPLWDNDV